MLKMGLKTLKSRGAMMMGAMMMGLLSVMPVAPVMAGGICETGPNAGVWVEDTSHCQQSGKTVDGLVKNVINLMLGVIGLLSIIMIIYAGLRYVISEGDANKIKQARQMLAYAVVGLVVALLAFAIVNFVLTGLFKK